MTTMEELKIWEEECHPVVEDSMSWCATCAEKGEYLKTNIKVPPVLSQNYKRKSNKLLSQAGLLKKTGS